MMDSMTLLFSMVPSFEMPHFETQHHFLPILISEKTQMYHVYCLVIVNKCIILFILYIMHYSLNFYANNREASD